MSFWKYITKTSWNQKKSDWAEFQKLCQQCTDAHNAVLAARDRISSIHAVKKYSQPSGCICYVVDEKQNMTERCCSLWYDCHGGVRYLDSKCDLADKNMEYHNACDKADKALEVMNEFWKNKFAHQK